MPASVPTRPLARAGSTAGRNGDGVFRAADLLARQPVRDLGRRLGVRTALHRAARTLGYDLVKRHYYSEVPDLDVLPASVWSARSELSGLRFDVEAGLRFVQRELAPFLAEFDPPLIPTGDPGEFHLQNSFYEAIDAHTLYAMVRRFNPRRVLELGSGYSTLVIAQARRRGSSAGDHRHDVYDPFARPELRQTLERVAHLHPIPAGEVDLAEFARLEDGDFLFVDTTHTVKIGGDVNRIILDVLPRLAPGVWVHFHDIYLPFEYPVEFFTDLGFSWAEQYLLQAFLAFNHEFEIAFGAAALARDHPDAIGELIPCAATALRPSAFWLRRAEPTRRAQAAG